DRVFAVRDREGKFGSGKTTRRFRRIDGLFGFSARLDGVIPVIRFPDGRTLRGDDPALNGALSAALGVEVTLAREERVSYFDAAGLHIVTSASLRWLQDQLHVDRVDVRRFRPNLLIETEGTGRIEQEWLGRQLAIGERLRLKVTMPATRCVMVTNPQDDLTVDVSILRALALYSEECFGVYAEVVEPGTIRCGDTAALLA
ncbi:MAG TPA: MOSC domain-containing protein, partial [Stellaceae bacterium]|nr:MOSC domain-containing protein [Stellaceae bacterium]